MFSGAPTRIQASHSSSILTRSGERSATSSGGAVSAQTVSNGQKSIPEKLSWTTGIALRRPIARMISSISGLRVRAPDDDDLPAGLDVDTALDEKARVLLDAWISHSSFPLAIART